jgi:hypothetical protein
MSVETKLKNISNNITKLGVIYYVYVCYGVGIACSINRLAVGWTQV